MSKGRLISGAAMGVGAAVFLLATITLAQDMPAPFGGPDDLAFADNLWTALEDENLVGANVSYSGLHEGQPPHGAVIETVERDISVDGRSAAAIVKYNFGPMGVSIEDTTNNPGQHLMAITVMFKRESGYDSDNKDWFWAKYQPDSTPEKNPMGMFLAGRVAKGMEAGCIFCHAAAPDGDYVFADSFAE